MTGVPPPGLHGGDALAVARGLGLDPDEVLDLSQSLNPVAPDPVPVVSRHLESIRRYPDASEATAALAAVMGVEQSRILLTNGGAEAISLVAGELGGRVVEPEFSLHPRGGDVLWRSNPHNPSGLLAGAAESADVWDEAFYPLASGRWTRGDDGSVVVGSLTKLLACPGLRVGYVLAPYGRRSLLERCRSRQPAWAVNGPALGALPELLAQVDLVDWSARMARLREDLVGVLRERGLEPRPSDANWVLVESPGLRQRLAPLGVVVRDCTSFGMPGVVRIAVPPASRLQQLESALSKIDRLAGAGRTGQGRGSPSTPGRSAPAPRRGTS